MSEPEYIETQEQGSPIINRVYVENIQQLPTGTAVCRWLGMQAVLCDDIADMIERKVAVASRYGNAELSNKIARDAESYRAKAVEYRQKRKNAEQPEPPQTIEGECSVCKQTNTTGRWCYREGCPTRPR